MLQSVVETHSLLRDGTQRCTNQLIPSAFGRKYSSTLKSNIQTDKRKTKTNSINE